MTEPLFFDTDCISAFLWVKEQSILVKMFPGRIGIPRQTYEELSIPEIPHLKSRVDQLIEGGQAQIVDINFDTEASRFDTPVSYAELGYLIKMVKKARD